MIKIASQKKKPSGSQGLTLVELIVVLGIMSVFVALVSQFQAQVFSFNRIFQGGIYAQMDANNVVKSMAHEIRSMSPSSAGAYSIDQASTSTLGFYNDIDDDGIKERIRYYLFGTDLKRGVIKPTGSPLVYNPASETFSTLISNVKNGTSTPIFVYYDTNYDGTATSSLSLPINVSSIRIVYINVMIDNGINQPLVPLSITTQTSIRNLKDNI